VISGSIYTEEKQVAKRCQPKKDTKTRIHPNSNWKHAAPAQAELCARSEFLQSIKTVFATHCRQLSFYNGIFSGGWHASLIAQHIVRTDTYSHSSLGNRIDSHTEINDYDFGSGQSTIKSDKRVTEYLGGFAEIDYEEQMRRGKSVWSLQLEGSTGETKFQKILGLAQNFAPKPPQDTYFFPSNRGMGSTQGSNSNNYVAYLLDSANLGQANTGIDFTPGLHNPTKQSGVGASPDDLAARDENMYKVGTEVFNDCTITGPYETGG